MSLSNKFVVLEGLDGSGTTTQLNKIYDYFQINGIPCWKTFEPSDGFIGKAARAILEKKETADPLTLAQLFAADRREHLKEIHERINKGEWVFCDRYLYSSLAYQSLDLSFDAVWDLNQDFPHPDICFYLECSIETSTQRRGGRSDSDDIYETEQLQHRVAINYEKAFDTLKHAPDVLHRIDGEATPEAITSRILKILNLNM